MIELSELRIGNLVLGPLKKDFGTVKRIETVVLIQHSLGHEDYFSPKEINPIPLTEEWLQRFGFKSDQNRFYMSVESDYGGGIDSLIVPGESVTVSCFDCDDGRIGAKFPYVHQLQNLYFALTGTELDLK